MSKRYSEALVDKNEALDKHDEMFDSVSHLNRRIEELESNKLHLLNKLKSYGDKGDLGYMVKTLGLENVHSKEFEGRVNIENYDPEANRAAADKQHAEERKKKKAELKNNPSQKSMKSGRSSKKHSSNRDKDDTTLPAI